MNRILTILIILIFAISCEKINESQPTFEQSVAFIIHKIDNKDIQFHNQRISNVEFKVMGNLCLYKFESYNEDLNINFESVNLFNLNDIKFANRESGHASKRNIVITLNTKSNNRITQSLNGKPIWNNSLKHKELINKVFIRVAESDEASVEKAFKNIIILNNNSRAVDYFENNK